jgi:hypothetical protein
LLVFNIRAAMGTVPAEPFEPRSPAAIPDGSDSEAFASAYEMAKATAVPFVCIAQSGEPGWTVTVDVGTSPAWPAADSTMTWLFAAATELSRQGIVRGGSASASGAVLYGLPTEAVARRIASALHAAVFNEPEPLRELLDIR